MSTEIKEYTCAMCGGVFETGWSDEEAKQEYAENFGPVISTHDEGVIVCDDCYNLIHPLLHPDKVEATKAEIIAQKPHN